MTTKKQSTKPAPSLSGAVVEALTSTEYNDVTGCVTVNVVDALMAIANAIHRLAAAHERANDREDRFSISAEEFKAALDRAALALNEGKPGHA